MQHQNTPKIHALHRNNLSSPVLKFDTPIYTSFTQKRNIAQKSSALKRASADGDFIAKNCHTP